MNKRSTETRRLYRSRRQRIIAGVCGGFAEFLNVDVTVVRVLWLIALFFNGLGFIAYLICLVLMRENPNEHITAEDQPATGQRNLFFAGLVIIFFGIVLLLRGTEIGYWLVPWHWFRFWRLDWDYVWPVLLVVIGVVLIVYGLNPKKDDAVKGQDARLNFYRSRNDRMIAGVLGGLAQAWKIDATLLRVGYAFVSIMSSVILGLVAYLVLTIVIPEEQDFPLNKNKAEK